MADNLKENIDSNKLPRHIGVIMDGNGRWAKKKGARRIFGHQNAIKAVRDTTEGCAELGISYLTLYAFSTENWARPQEEVDGLMQLLVSTIRNEMDTLTKNNVKLATIGNIEKLPASCNQELKEAMDLTSQNSGLTLILALNYSGRSEIVDACKELLREYDQNKFSIDKLEPSDFEKHLHTRQIPDPELLIRTSGEMRISNFLLWQIAYTELYFCPTLWPDFRKKDLHMAILDYQKRERRFGKVIL